MVNPTYYNQKYAKEEKGDNGESEAIREVKKKNTTTRRTG